MINSQVMVLKKGQYTKKLNKDFIEITEYLKVVKNNKNLILIRLKNNLEYTITSLKFKVIEYDKDGAKIRQSICNYANLNILAGKLTALNRGINVTSECEDFKIEIIRAKSKRYEYVVNGDDVSVYYIMPNFDKKPISGAVSAPSVSKIHNYNVTKIMVASVTSLLLIMLSTYLVMYSNYTKDVDGTSIWLKIAIDVWNAVKAFAINLATIISNATVNFVTVILPEFLKVVWQGIVWFITQGVPIAFKATIKGLTWFFTIGVPIAGRAIWQGLTWFFKIGVPIAFNATWQFIKFIAFEIGIFFKGLFR